MAIKLTSKTTTSDAMFLSEAQSINTLFPQLCFWFLPPHLFSFEMSKNPHGLVHVFFVIQYATSATFSCFKSIRLLRHVLCPESCSKPIFVDDDLSYSDSTALLQCFQSFRKILGSVYILIFYTNFLPIFEKSRGP